MDLVDTAFSLIGEVRSKALDIRAIAEDCALLANFAMRTAPFVEHLSSHGADAGDFECGMEIFIESLKLVETILTDSSTNSELVVAFLSETLINQLKKAASTMSYGLSVISTSCTNVEDGLKAEIGILIEDLKATQFRQLIAFLEETAKLRRLLETGFYTNEETGQEVIEIVKNLVNDHSRTLVDQQNDLALLKRRALQAANSKERWEAYYLQQVINVVEKHVISESNNSESKKAKSGASDISSYLLCPISGQRMTDPVLVKESGMTYDRSSIVEWFDTGNITDPQTNLRLSSREIIPNHFVRQLLDLETTQGGLSRSVRPSAHNTPCVNMCIKPGIWEGRRRTNGGDVSVGVVHIMLLFNPTGSVFGFEESIPDGNGDRCRVMITGGYWNQQSLSFRSIRSDSPVLISSGSIIKKSARHPQAIGLELETKVAICMVRNDSPEGWPLYIKLNAIEYESVTQPSPLQHFVFGCGLMQLDGTIYTKTKERIWNRVVLLLELKGAIQGWMYVDGNKSVAETYFLISEGEWEDKESSLTFHIDISNKAHNESDQKPATQCRVHFTGKIEHYPPSHSLRGPVFRGECRPLNEISAKGKSGVSKDFGQLIKDGGSFEYNQIAATPTQASMKPEGHMTLLPPPKAPEWMPGFAGPGLYKIRIWSKGHSGREAVSKYLKATSNARNSQSFWADWCPDNTQGTVWSIRRFTRMEGWCLQVTDAGKYNGYQLVVHDDKEDDHAPCCAHTERLKEEHFTSTFKFVHNCHGLIAVHADSLKDYGRRYLSHVLGAKGLTQEGDWSDTEETRAVVYEDWSKAIPLELQCVGVDAALMAQMK